MSSRDICYAMMIVASYHYRCTVHYIYESFVQAHAWRHSMMTMTM
jgi:hypothetical protein